MPADEGGKELSLRGESPGSGQVNSAQDLAQRRNEETTVDARGREEERDTLHLPSADRRDNGLSDESRRVAVEDVGLPEVVAKGVKSSSSPANTLKRGEVGKGRRVTDSRPDALGTSEARLGPREDELQS